MQTQTHHTTPTAVRPFGVDIPAEALADLRRCLAAAQWPDEDQSNV